MTEPKTFLLQYAYKGKWYCFDIVADDWEQAEALENMSPHIKLDGEKIYEIPFDEDIVSWNDDFILIKRKI